MQKHHVWITAQFQSNIAWGKEPTQMITQKWEFMAPYCNDFAEKHMFGFLQNRNARRLRETVKCD